jgi:preprotein translocase subunit SecG
VPWVVLSAAALTSNEIGSTFVNAVKIGLQVMLVLSGLLLTLLVLLHKGKGGGLSDMFGGGMSSTMSGSSVAERNLDRFTVALGLVWGATVIGLNLIERFTS